MGKKLTEASKWRNQRWFRLLPPISKLVLCYLEGVCDIDGTWEIDCADLMYDLGLDPPFNLDEFITSVNTQCDKLSGQPIICQRIVKIGTNYLWLVDYVKLQCESMEFNTLNPAGKFVQKAFYKLGAKGVLAEGILRGWIPLSIPIDTLSIPSKYPIDTPRDIDIDIERDIELLGRLYLKEGKVSKREPEKKAAGEPSMQVVRTEGPNTPPPDLPIPPVLPEMEIAEFKEFEGRILVDEVFLYTLTQNTGWSMKDESAFLTLTRRWLKRFNVHIASREDLRKNYVAYKEHFKNWLIGSQDFSKPPPDKVPVVTPSSRVITAESVEKYQIKSKPVS